MQTIKKTFPFLMLGFIALSVADCKKTAETEAAFIDQEIFTTGTDYRVHGLEDLFYFSAEQALLACQEDCAKLKAAVSAAADEVGAMQSLLLARVGGIQPPPPPRPCGAGSCIWDLLAIYKYFVDLKKYNTLPVVQIQNLNGEVLASSDQATVAYAPGGQFAVVSLPKAAFQDKAVKMVIRSGDRVAEVVVAIQ